MQSTDKIIQYSFFLTKLLVILPEAIFFIDQFPDLCSIVVGIWLDVRMHVEILALIVWFVLDMPDPSLNILSFGAPEISTFWMGKNLVGTTPKLRDIFISATTDTAATWFTKLFEDS